MPSITIVFTSVAGTSVTYTITSVGVNGTLMASYSITSAFKFKQAIITFDFVNPARAINCTSTPVFNLAFHDFKKNSILA